MPKNQPVVLINLSAEQLVDYLDAVYPHRCIKPNDSLEDAHRYAGMRELVDKLKTRMTTEKEKNDRSTQISVR